MAALGPDSGAASQLTRRSPMPNSWTPRAHSGMRFRAIGGSGTIPAPPQTGSSTRCRGAASESSRQSPRPTTCATSTACSRALRGAPRWCTRCSRFWFADRADGLKPMSYEWLPYAVAPHHGCHLAASLSICHGARDQSVKVERWQERADAVSCLLEDVWRTPRARALFALPRRRLATGLRRKRAPRLALLTLSLRRRRGAVP